MDRNVRKYIKSKKKFCPCCLKNKESIIPGPEFLLDPSHVKKDKTVKLFYCKSCESVWNEYRTNREIDTVDIRVDGTSDKSKKEEKKSDKIKQNRVESFNHGDCSNCGGCNNG